MKIRYGLKRKTSIIIEYVKKSAALSAKESQIKANLYIDIIFQIYKINLPNQTSSLSSFSMLRKSIDNLFTTL